MLRLLGFLSLLLLFGALFAWHANSAPETVEVELVSVESGNVFVGLSLNGELVNDRTVTLTALIDGEVTEVLAREGDRVEEGRTLAQLNAVTAQAMLNKAQAELTIAKSNTANARSSFNRAQDLRRLGNISEELYEQAQLDLRKSQAEEVIAQSSVTIASRTVRDSTIRAPFAGQVITKAVETGQWVEAGTPLFTLVAETGQVIEAYVDAADIARVAVGQPAKLSSDAWQFPWFSSVEWIAPVIANSARSRSGDVPPNAIAIRLPVGLDAPELRLGQQVDVELQVASRNQVAKLPLTALREHSQGGFEVLMINNGKVVAVPVETGVVTTDVAEITGGLILGEQVIGSGIQSLEVGTAVRVRSD